MNELRDQQARSKERMTILAWLRNYRWEMLGEERDAIDDVIDERCTDATREQAVVDAIRGIGDKILARFDGEDGAGLFGIAHELSAHRARASGARATAADATARAIELLDRALSEAERRGALRLAHRVMLNLERGTHLKLEPVAEMLMDLERLPTDDQQTTETLAATVASYASKNIVEFLERYSDLGAQLANAARLSRIPLSAIHALKQVTMKGFPDDPKASWAERVYARLLSEIEHELFRRAESRKMPQDVAASE